ncbi:DNA polymerase III subunit delta [Candidatus Saccharibacteria bacterium]|nr:DNA polymerase III subunit delta [Candidatus Saccharibacteria bacterium]
MITTLTGNNQYLIRRRLNELVDKFEAEHGELALQKIDAEEADPGAILEAVQSLPFLASRKMVVVRGLGANKTASEQIEQIISSGGDTTDIVFYEPAVDRRTAYYKVLKSLTTLEEYNDLDIQKLAGWLAEEAKNQSGELSYSDANYLVERVGTSQELLANELQKLITYNSKISRDTIDLLTVKTPQSKVFDLLDAAFAGNKKRALELYAEQRAQKVEPQAIIALIAWQLELIALAFYGKGRDSNQIAKEAGVSPYPVTKAQRLASTLSLSELTDMINRALYIDEQSKTTQLDLDEALKTYIVTL